MVKQQQFWSVQDHAMTKWKAEEIFATLNLPYFNYGFAKIKVYKISSHLQNLARIRIFS